MWAIFAFGSSIAAAISSVFQKETLKHLHAVQLMTVTSIITAVFSLFLLPFAGFNFCFEGVALVALYSVMIAFASVFTIRAMRHLDVSIVAPFFNLGTAFAAVFAFFFFKEIVTPLDWIGIILLIVGGYLLELKHKNLFQPIKEVLKSTSLHYLLGGVLLFSGGFLVAKFALNYISPVGLFAVQQIFGLLIYSFMTFAFYGGLRDIKLGFKNGKMMLIPMAVLIFAENIMLFEALKVGEASLVIPLYRTWTLWAVIFGGRILHENHMSKRAVSAVLMIAGAILILI